MPVSQKRPATAGRRRAARRRNDAQVTESRRHEILNEAVRLMEEKGFAAMSIQHVADSLEFSKANFYHHINSKESLLYDIFMDTLQYSLGHIEEIFSDGRSFTEQLRDDARVVQRASASE
jgi:AcrR family transcriptional regulator